MEEIKKLFEGLSKLYNGGKEYRLQSKELVVKALALLRKECSYQYYGDYKGLPAVEYFVYSRYGELSRPIRPGIYYEDPNVFAANYDALIDSFGVHSPLAWKSKEKEIANNVVYTGVMAVACCYDLWERGSRKTPGTFFEIFMAGILREYLAEYYFSKHIPLTDILPISEVDIEMEELLDGEESSAAEDENASSVATDLAIRNQQTGHTLVVPLKITTRERIVQPFAHQRILDSAYGEGKFTSLLVCISETQLMKKKKQVNQICVPGPVKLFQRYLAALGGIYYCDIPQRYDAPDVKRVITIKSVGDFFVDACEMLRK